MCLELKWVIQKSRYNVKSLAKILEGCEQSIQLRVCKHPKKTNKRASRKDNMKKELIKFVINHLKTFKAYPLEFEYKNKVYNYKTIIKIINNRKQQASEQRG